MLDFRELPVDGQAFEQLIREILFSKGLHVQWSGVGQDGGRDLLCRETLTGEFGTQQRTWLVQCKHFAHADRSVGIADLDDIVDSCNHHGATGYVLACSTQPSSGVIGRLEGITGNPLNSIQTAYWDAVHVERLLAVPSRWAIAQRFFPKSAEQWKVYATERPNDFVAHYKGYVFHLTNRIGSSSEGHLSSVSSRISEIEALGLPAKQFIRPRCVYYDDKNGGYTWYIDYMFPQGSKPALRKSDILHQLNDGWALDDGQCYSWDVKFVSYHEHSDHYDEDHYDYYTRYMPNYLTGSRREESRDYHEHYATKQQLQSLEEAARTKRDLKFEDFLTSLRDLPFVTHVTGRNAVIEEAHRFARRRNWQDIMNEIGWASGNFLDVKVGLSVSDEDKLHGLLSTWPQEIEAHFRIAKAIVYLPGGERSDDEDFFDLSISVHPAVADHEWAYRKELDDYLERLARANRSFLKDMNQTK